jgi:hypothetical protein
MKNLILLLAVVVGLGFAGSPQLKNRNSFDFGGNIDNVFSMFFCPPDKVFVGGKKSSPGGSSAALYYANLSNGENWTSLDSFPATSSISVGQDSGIYWSTFVGYLKKSNDSGRVIWNKRFSNGELYVLSYNGYPVICSQSSVCILDKDGQIIKEIPINSENPQGSWFPKIGGNKLWLFGSPNSKPGTAIMVLDLESGEKLWEKYFPLNIRTTGVVDSEGNGYLVATRIIEENNSVNEFVVTKLDSNGNQLWQTSWFGRDNNETNMENWIDGAAVSSDKNLVILTGSIQKGATHTGSKSAYLAGLNATSGKLVWGNVISYRDGYLESTRAAEFTDSGKLLVSGFSVSNLDFNPPNLIYLDIYEVDKLLGVENPKNQMPSSFGLYQNYPNPFNPSTTIRYSLSKQSYVRLVVYDLLGREIAVLVDSEMGAGEQEVHFNSNNLSSGTYIYQLQAGGQMETKRMVLLK